MTGDWVVEMFPGDGAETPSDDERDRADALIDTWAARWREQSRTIDRTHPDGRLAGRPTNRAFLRAGLRRWWLGAGQPL